MKISILVKGLGTIGTSLACALSKVGSYNVFGTSRNPLAIDFAYKKGFIKNAFTYDDGCDIEIICAPKQAVIDILTNKDTLGSIIIDICGTKSEIVSQVLKQNIQDKYVSIHPMVHIEPKGYQFYKEDAFCGATVFIIDEFPNDDKVNKFVIELLKNIGVKKIIPCSSIEHDTIFKFRF